MPMKRSEEPAMLEIPGIVGRSPAFQEVGRTIRSVATTNAGVLIQGETGTGKEQVARAIHAYSARSGEAFVVVDCASIPETLLESTLFGHEKGAFTGAAAARPGMLELADRGTLFLDEVGELPVHLQAKLLRSIQEQRFYRIGGVKEIQVDVRWLAATNRNLEEAVRRGQFREDLYYRLKVITVEMPPLRQRVEDIPLLAEFFLRKFADRHGKQVHSILPEAMQCLQWYPWPGNVRQLENLIERLVVLAEEPTIRMRDLPKELASAALAGGPVPGESKQSPDILDELIPLKVFREHRVKEIEEEYAVRLLKYTRGNIAAAARIAGISVRSFYRLLDRCGLAASLIREREQN